MCESFMMCESFISSSVILTFCRRTAPDLVKASVIRILFGEARGRPPPACCLTSRPPYPEQETEELGDDIVARLNPDTGGIESLEILFFSTRPPRTLLELPVTADFRRAG